MNEKIKMENELYHFGIKGMRWGVRRYQNPDGSLTNAGKKRLSKGHTSNEENDSSNKSSTKSSSSKTVKEMSDDELSQAITRLQLEEKYKSLSPKNVSKGKIFVDTVANDVLKPAAIDIGKQVAKSLMVKGVNSLVKDESLKVYTNNKKKN